MTASNPTPVSPTDPERSMLLRALGPGAAIAVVVGNVIGSGIFYKPGSIAAEAGDFRLIIIAWIIGGGVCILGGLCFAELAVMLPEAGGIYVYLRESFGKGTAFLFGWNEFLFSRPASTGALAVAFIGTLGGAMGRVFTTWEVIGLSFLLIAFMAWVNVMGVVWGGRLQSLATLIKAGTLAIVGLAPFVLMAMGNTMVDFGNFATTVEPRSESLTGRFAVVFLGVMWAYNGWHGITPVAEEIKNPQRNIPLALFGGIGILISLYLLANLAYHSVLPMDEMAQAGEQASVVMVDKMLGPQWSMAMRAVIMWSALGTINSNLLISPRVPFAMGRDGLLFKPFGWVHSNYRTPAAAILTQASMGALLVAVSGMLLQWGITEKENTVFDLLTSFVVFGASVFYLLAVVAVFVLRYKRPEWHRPYRTWGYPVVPTLFIAFYVWFLSQVFMEEPDAALYGLGLIATGIPVYLFVFRKVSVPPRSESAELTT